MFQTETPSSGIVPKLDGRAALGLSRQPLRGRFALAALFGGGVCTALWLAALAWLLFELAKRAFG